MAMFLHRYIYDNNNKNIYMFIYKKKNLKNVYAFLMKLLATTTQLTRRNSICCLKNQILLFEKAVSLQSEYRDDPCPPPVRFHSLFKDTPPQQTLY